MPNPVPLATKEEEERRAWVTAHHEVVRLCKDCFGDRFSNNEIFDRLKISRRTGYRALGNDDRIGKAPGRKPKITENIIRLMIDYIENGGCNDVGNVWKHLAERFAPDCNPKTVQDAVKKSGFRNYRNTVRLEPLLNEEIPEDHQTPEEESQQPQPIPAPKSLYHTQPPEPMEPSPQLPLAQQPVQHQVHQQQNVIDPSFHPYNLQDMLKQAVYSAHETNIRFLLWDLCTRSPDAQRFTASALIPNFVPNEPGSLPQISHMHRVDQSLPVPVLTHGEVSGKKTRIAVCRRCGQQYDREENNMDNRACLYHKGSTQKISPDEGGTIEESPEAYIWSCCGGNGMVRGCCRAMHTTKKKRNYEKKGKDGTKRKVTGAALDETNDTTLEDSVDADDDTTMMVVDSQLEDRQELDNPNIDSSLQDMQSNHLPSIHMQMFNTDLPSPFLHHGHLPAGSNPQDSSHNGLSASNHMQSNGQMSHDVPLQLIQSDGQNHEQ